jgi:hypothetical protein
MPYIDLTSHWITVQKRHLAFGSALKPDHYESWVLPIAIPALAIRPVTGMTALRGRRGKRQELTLAPVTLVPGFDALRGLAFNSGTVV